MSNMIWYLERISFLRKAIVGFFKKDFESLRPLEHKVIT